VAAQPQIFSMQRHQLLLRLHTGSFLMSETKTNFHARPAITGKLACCCACSTAFRLVCLRVFIFILINLSPLHYTAMGLRPLRKVLRR
jgi:hypothetical protein